MTTIFDNIDERLGEKLVETLEVSDRLDAAIGYFNLRGWRDLSAVLEDREAGSGPVARLLVGMTMADPHDRVVGALQAAVNAGESEPEIDAPEARRRRELALHRFRQQLMRGIPSDADLSALRRMRRHLVDGLLQVKLFTRRPMHAKTYICHRSDVITPIVGFVGSSNLTLAGLKHQYELNVDVVDGDAAQKLAQWFDERWDDKFTLDITKDLIRLIDESWASEEPVDPYLVYLKVCYLVSQEARDGLVEYSLPAAMQRQLLEFQASAVKTLARRVAHRGGAMLGDVVGLGKTITAVAVALMLREDHGYSTLVVCPKNLVKMWEEYLDAYELFGKVIPYSMAVKELPELRRHQFVILDESHTLRSNTRQDYEAIYDYVRANDSKVLMLTATPYNKRYLDVANQLALFIDEDDNLGIAPMEAIRRNPAIIDQVDGKVSTLLAFRKSEEPDDWRRLMSEHLVRRTRGFIRSNFAELDPENSREFVTFADGSRFYFPERTARPLPHSFGEDDPARMMVDDSTLDVINDLRLPRYGLARYVSDEATPSTAEAKILADLERGSGHLLGFTRTSLYKRLSSCGRAFVLSLERHLARNRLYLHALANDLDIPVGAILESMVAVDTDDDSDDDDLAGPTPEQQYAELARRPRPAVRWMRSALFDDSLREDLEADAVAIEGLLAQFGSVDHESDSKIEALTALLSETHPDEKILIFSEYKDTVDYVADALMRRGISDVEAVSGQTTNPTKLAHRFSPKSNRRLLGGATESSDDEIRVLVTTDVLSEGQNLQDSHIVVMYDLPWAIIRLIQRAGRVDRVGQESEEVLVYSFLPDDGVEAVLDLRSRIRRRLAESASVFGSDEQFFGTDDETRTIKDLYDGHLDETDDGEVDAASYAFQVWQRAEIDYPDMADRARALPDLVYATKDADSVKEPTGVLAYARTEQGFDGFGVVEDGAEPRLLTAFEALRMLECSPSTAARDKRDDHFDRVAELVGGPLQRPQLAAGQLRGTRLKVWRRLNATTDASVPDAERALEAIYGSPLTAEAENRLKVALRERSNEDLAELLALLHRDDKLVVSSDAVNDPLRIVCSMGLVRP
jgi:superfamily II DNA or RNA helicase